MTRSVSLAVIIDSTSHLHPTHTFVLIEHYNSVDGPRARISGQLSTLDQARLLFEGHKLTLNPVYNDGEDDAQDHSN